MRNLNDKGANDRWGSTCPAQIQRDRKIGGKFHSDGKPIKSLEHLSSRLQIVLVPSKKPLVFTPVSSAPFKYRSYPEATNAGRIGFTPGRHVRSLTVIGKKLVGFIFLWSLMLPSTEAYAQGALPTPDQLDQLLAPIALYPDALVAQICAASTDPQQILDVDNWLHQNMGLSGQARTDAAQAQGFDPAFVALVNFPQVLDMMAQNIDNFAGIGQAFAANQGTVMDSVQRLRQQAYASGALESNQYQTVQLQNQGSSQVVVIQPANPQIVYVPQFNPQVVYAQPSSAFDVATPLLTFGAGIALGAWMNNNRYPWGWGGWGWNWGSRRMLAQNNYWVVNNRYRPRFPSYRFRPPVYNRPVYVRPPSNWQSRPNYRPPSSIARPPVNRPPIAGSGPPGGRPPGTRVPTRQPNPNAGYARGPGWSNSGGRTSAFGGGNNATADRSAINRGRASVSSQQRQHAGGPRK